MSLLREIYEDAMGTDVPLVAVLRKCKVLAFRLGYAPLASWVDLDLGGYPDDASLPEYRVFPVGAIGNFVGPGGASASEVPIGPEAIPDEIKDARDELFTAYVSQGIASIEDLVGSDDTSFRRPWPQAVLPHLHGRVLIEYFQCVQAWRSLPRGGMVGVLDAVRNKVLSFALEIEAIDPAAGDTEPGADPVVASEAIRSVAVNVFGDGNILAVGERARVQHVVLVAKGDWESLRLALVDVGLSTEDLMSLRGALATDGAGSEMLGPATQGWLATLKEKATAGLGAVAPEAIGAVVGGAILQYLGFA